MLQQAILPAGLFKVIAFLIAIAIALVAIWFAFLKPAVESTARAVVEDHTEELAKAVADGNEIAEEANEQSAQAAKDAAAAQKTSEESSKTTEEVEKLVTKDGDTTTAATLDSTRATDFRITTKSAPRAGFEPFTYEVPEKKILWISDPVLQNPAGYTGTLRIRRGDDVLFEFGLENFRDLDYHLIQPMGFTSKDDVMVDVACRNDAGDCTPSVYFTGRITDEPKPKKKQQ